MINIKDLEIDFSEFSLNNINLSVENKDFMVLMGPTGAGKTVLLEAIAGLIPIKKGHIFIGGKEITYLPPEKRGISIVYQDHALFPHLTVLENIRYGLQYHKIDKKEANNRLKYLIDELNINHLTKRLPLNLSGGELQRVALARALIINPSVLLLDEPLSALDPRFREEVRKGLKRLHQTTNTTFLMVTHDFAEALSLATKGAVMNNGTIEQVGAVEDLFQKPQSPFVADFVGMKNLLSAIFKDTKAIVHALEIELGREVEDNHGYIAIRPEDIVLSKASFISSMRNSFEGSVVGIINQGFYWEVKILVADVIFISLITKKSLFELKIKEGEQIFLSFKSTAIHTF